jgi:excisionase family DNA binding protein
MAAPLLYTSEEAAACLRVRPQTIRRMIRDGELTGVKVGGKWRIPEHELTRIAATQTPYGRTTNTSYR